MAALFRAGRRRLEGRGEGWYLRRELGVPRRVKGRVRGVGGVVRRRGIAYSAGRTRCGGGLSTEDRGRAVQLAEVSERDLSSSAISDHYLQIHVRRSPRHPSTARVSSAAGQKTHLRGRGLDRWGRESRVLSYNPVHLPALFQPPHTGSMACASPVPTPQVMVGVYELS